MIARPVIRPAPIPFDAPSPKPGASQPRAISWAAASGPAEHPPLCAQPKSFSRPSLSPAHASLPAAPRPCAGQSRASEAGQRSASIKAPYEKAAHLSELFARYLGQGALSVRSSVTGRHYRFQGHGDSQKVDKHDLMLLKRIADIEIK